MKSPREVTDEEIRLADWINAVDRETGHCEIVWGLDEKIPGAARRHASILDVAVAKENVVGLLNLIDRIENVRGRLPPHVEALRENLKIATLVRPKIYWDEDVVIPDYFRG
jgi:hypothetical protein